MSVKLSRTTEIAWGKTRQGHKTSSSFIFNHGTRTYRGIQKTLIFIQDIQGDSENKNLPPEHTGGLRKHEPLTRLYRGSRKHESTTTGPWHTGRSRKHESTTTGPWHTGDPENPNLQPRDHCIQGIQKILSSTTCMTRIYRRIQKTLIYATGSERTGGSRKLQSLATGPVAEFKEFERRFKYGWFHLKLYQMFQDLSRRLV